MEHARRDAGASRAACSQPLRSLLLVCLPAWPAHGDLPHHSPARLPPSPLFASLSNLSYRLTGRRHHPDRR